jgi:hypothetical protein
MFYSLSLSLRLPHRVNRRTGIEFLLAKVLPHWTVCVYTSAQAGTTEQLVQLCFGPDWECVSTRARACPCACPPHCAELGSSAIYDTFSRELCHFDPTGEDPWDTRVSWLSPVCPLSSSRVQGAGKDLELIWQQESIRGYFGPTNTVIVENTLRKVRYFQDNLILVPEFEDRGVRSGRDTILFEVRRNGDAAGAWLLTASGARFIAGCVLGGACLAHASIWTPRSTRMPARDGVSAGHAAGPAAPASACSTESARASCSQRS